MSDHIRRIMTSGGPARLHHHGPPAGEGRGTVLLGHGAGGGVESADLTALARSASADWHVVLVEQPWRVAGRRLAVRPAALDAATNDVLDVLDHEKVLPRPWVLGGRSAGARVACRLSARAQACLLIAFPLVPRRRDGSAGPSRAQELLIPLQRGLSTLVVQGERDPFGGPSSIRDVAPQAEVVGYPGDHRPPRDLAALSEHVEEFLDRLA